MNAIEARAISESATEGRIVALRANIDLAIETAAIEGRFSVSYRVPVSMSEFYVRALNRSLRDDGYQVMSPPGTWIISW